MGSIEPRYYGPAFSAFVRFDNAQSEAQLRDAFTDVIAPFGYEHFVFASSRVESSLFDKMILLEKWPRGWTQQYQRENLFPSDPVANLARVSFDAFTWDEAARHARSRSARRVMQISATDFDLRQGFGVPVHGVSGYQATISVAGHDVEAGDDAHKAIELISSYAYKTALKLKSKLKIYVLTPREREIMIWAAAGKTAWDTGEILHISEQTVKSHISSVLAKLQVCSKTQAVAESIRLGEIRP